MSFIKLSLLYTNSNDLLKQRDKKKLKLICLFVISREKYKILFLFKNLLISGMNA
jgi:hypothetical protein